MEAIPASPMALSRDVWPLTSRPYPSGWMLRGEVSASSGAAPRQERESAAAARRNRNLVEPMLAFLQGIKVNVKIHGQAAGFDRRRYHRQNRIGDLFRSHARSAYRCAVDGERGLELELGQDLVARGGAVQEQLHAPRGSKFQGFLSGTEEAGKPPLDILDGFARDRIPVFICLGNRPGIQIQMAGQSKRLGSGFQSKGKSVAAGVAYQGGRPLPILSHREVERIVAGAVPGKPEGDPSQAGPAFHLMIADADGVQHGLPVSGIIGEENGTLRIQWYDRGLEGAVGFVEEGIDAGDQPHLQRKAAFQAGAVRQRKAYRSVGNEIGKIEIPRKVR